MQAREPVGVERVVPGHVEVLAADHPERRLGQDPRNVGRLVGERLAERLGQKRVSGQNRDVLAEPDVRARPPAPEVVVVERRQIVVDEAEGVDELERAGGGQELARLAAERLAGREAEHRPDPLTAGEERVAERVVERAQLLRERQLREAGLDELAKLVRVRIVGRLAAEPVDLPLHVAGELGHRGQLVDRVLRVVGRLELRERLVQLSKELLQALGGRVCVGCVGHAASLAILPRIPFTSRAASSEA